MEELINENDRKGTIYLQRVWQYIGSLSNFRVYINGELVGKIANGSQEKYQLETGLYEINIKAPFAKPSRPFKVNISSNQIVSLRCGHNLWDFFNMLVIEDSSSQKTLISSSRESIFLSTITFIILYVIISFIFFLGLTILYNNGMSPTIKSGEAVIIDISKKYYFPDREDIVAIKLEKPDGKKLRIIQRVIGLPGEQIAIKNNNLYIDNEIFKRDYLSGNFDRGYSRFIPNNRYFVLADNLDESQFNSLKIGLVSREQLSGKIIIVMPTMLLYFIFGSLLCFIFIPKSFYNFIGLKLKRSLHKKTPTK